MAKREKEVDPTIAKIVELGEQKYILALEHAIKLSEIAPPEVLRITLQKEIDRAKEKNNGRHIGRRP